MESDEFNALVKGFFGRRATQGAFDPDALVFSAVLYETFPVRCGLDGDHGTFTAAIESVSGHYLMTFFGRYVSLNPDSESITASLALIDEWCRLHLPDKFLERYDAAVAQVGADDF